ncbi:Ger(x)C family spore germination protein [Salimicrobium halophilum]|uniref:Germination protein, Ger(X)C family n=1 Tax=Salimicrobium halophilum TaxID=86666 RepID=A0A1G8QY23_9BACI|nr:Ger(x)C family spore germination protein [Salimicrobium halophilum]SDJ09513.1 germination protein, Ger(x)C family [Salimicrobium halophilum]
MTKLYRKVILVLLSLGLLTGCWDGKTIEHMLYVSGLGIGYENEELVVYARFIELENVGKQEGGGGPSEDKPIWIAKGTGKTFDIATDDLYYTSQLPISWAHLGEIVITTEALKQDGIINEVMDVLNRYSETRSEVILHATKEELPLVAQGRPILGTSTWYSKVNNPYPVFRQFSLVRPITSRQYLIDQEEPGKVLDIPMLSLDKSKWQRGEEPHPTVEFGGSAFVYKGKFKGSLPVEEERGIRWMQEESQRVPLYLFNSKKDYASIVFTSPSVDITPEIKGEEVTVSVDVKVKGSIIENPFYQDEKTLEKDAEEEIKKQIKDTYKYALEKNIDVYQFAYHVYKKHPEKFKELGIEDKDWLKPETFENLNVQVSIVSSGKLKINK